MSNLRIKTSPLIFLMCLIVPIHAQSTIITLGINDVFNTSSGTEVMTRSAGFNTYLTSLGSPVGTTFDDPSVNVLKGFTFDLTGTGKDILAGELIFLARPHNDSKGEGNDKIYLSGYDSTGSRLFTEFTIGFGVDVGPNNYFPFDWQIGTAQNPENGYLVTLDLANFAAQQGLGIDILAFLNQFRILDVTIGDDTTTDYARLELTYKAPEVPVPEPGTLCLVASSLLGFLTLRKRGAILKGKG